MIADAAIVAIARSATVISLVTLFASIIHLKIKYEYISQDLTEKLYDYTLEIKAGETLVRRITGYHNNDSTIIVSPPLLSGIAYDYSLKPSTINKYEMSVNGTISQDNSIPTDSFTVESDSEY